MRIELSPALATGIPGRPVVAADPRSFDLLRGIVLVLVGLGNIGSPLCQLIGRQLCPLGVRLRLIDRDVVEAKNLVNQCLFDQSDIGRAKVDVHAEAVRRICPDADIESLCVDLEETTTADFADAALCAAGLDSLRSRQCLITDRAWPLNLAVIDGGVGEPSLGRIHTYVPGSACPECSWGDAHYRQLAREYPCSPGARPSGPPTNVPAFVGATVASIMAGECWRWLTGRRSASSYEIAFDLDSLRFSTGTLHRASRCRFHHHVSSAPPVRNAMT